MDTVAKKKIFYELQRSDDLASTKNFSQAQFNAHDNNISVGQMRSRVSANMLYCASEQ